MINTFIASNPVRFLTATLGKGGIGGGGGCAADTGDLGLGIMISFLLPGGINSGGSTLGIAYFSNALYTRCMACNSNNNQDYIKKQRIHGYKHSFTHFLCNLRYKFKSPLLILMKKFHLI